MKMGHTMGPRIISALRASRHKRVYARLRRAMTRPHGETGRAAVRPLPVQSSECVMSMTYNPYSIPCRWCRTDWIPRETSEIDINNERELAYWCNELRISIGDLIWLVEKHGTSAERIRAMVK